MFKGKLSFIKVLIALCVGLLSACASDGPDSPYIAVDDAMVNKTAPKALTRFQFNQQLEQDLNTKNASQLQNKIDVLSIAKQLRFIQPQQFANPLATAKAAAELKQQLVVGMLDLSNTFTWRYLYSEIFSDNKIAAYYRIDNDEGYSYITFWQDANDYKIFDFHPVSFHYSALHFVSEFTQLFSKYSSRQAQLSNLIIAIQKNELDKALTYYQSLDADIKVEPALTDFLLRKYSQMENESSEFKAALIENYEQQNLNSLLFESYYIQQDNFTQAIKMIQGLPHFALTDSKMQSELAILHAYNQDFTQAILFGRQAIFAEPNENEAYFVLLQVSLLAKDYSLSIELINVLISKFEFVMGQEVIAEFDDSDNFMRSEEYQQWRKAHSVS
jgi:hypothetical protein